MTRIRGVIGIALGIAALSCSDGHPAAPDTETDTPATTPPPPAGMVVSNALAVASSANFQVPFAAATSTVAYVSAEPGTFASAASVLLRNPARNAVALSARVIGGGFDPLGIPAEAGDELSLTISNIDGTTTKANVKVPARRPPRVVRTSPSRGRIDVALNVQVEVVFTEPVDRSTITTASIALVRDGQPVAGSITVSDDGLSATFIPNAPLESKATYTFVVGTGVHDLDGEGLTEQADVEFTTLDVNVTPEGTGTSTDESRGIAFVRDGSILVNGESGTQPVSVVAEALRPAWSPDGTQLAFTRPSTNVLSRWQVCIVRANGLDERCATGDVDGIVTGTPSWSPDGANVAFSYFAFSCPGGQCGQLGGSYSKLSILNIETMHVIQLDTPPTISTSWSPDGSKIAFTMFGEGTYGRGALGVANLDGSKVKILAMSLGSYSVREVTWSPDGRSLALVMNDESACPWYCNTAIGIADANGNLVTVLDRAQTCFLSSSCRDQEAYIWGAPAWSRDGSYVAYTVTKGGECFVDERVSCGTDIKRVGVQDGRVEVLVSRAGFPSWRH